MANNNVIEKTNNLDKTIPVDPIGYLYTNETQAHQFIISCTRKGEKVRLTGSVTARFVTSQNTYFVVHGSIVNGNAVITLHQDCYSIPGHFDLAIFVTSGTETTVVYAAVGTVKRTDSVEGVITGEPLPTLDELLDVVRDAQQIVSDFDDIILVQDTQPNSETNRIWVQPQADEYQVPTYEEFEDLKNTISEPTRNLWLWGDQSVTGSKLVTSSANIPAGTYTLSALVTKNESGNVRMLFYKQNATSGELLANPYIAANSRNSKTFTLAEDCHRIVVYSAANSSGQVPAVWSDIQIESGSTATDYVPPLTAIDVTARKDADGVVKYTEPQTLTDTQKTTARSNIGAADVEEVSGITSRLNHQILLTNETYTGENTTTIVLPNYNTYTETPIISCDAMFTRNSGVTDYPRVRIVMNNARNLERYTTWYQVGKEGQYEIREWRAPAFEIWQNNEIRISIYVPAGCALTIRRLWYRFDSSVDRTQARGINFFARAGTCNMVQELTIPAMQMSYRHGYDTYTIIPKRSSDGVWFCYHDDTFDIATTQLRLPNGNKITSDSYNGKYFDEIPFAHLYDNYVYGVSGTMFLDTKIMTCDECFEFLAKTGMKLRLSLHPYRGVNTYLSELKRMMQKYGLLDDATIIVNDIASVFTAFGNDIGGYCFPNAVGSNWEGSTKRVDVALTDAIAARQTYSITVPISCGLWSDSLFANRTKASELVKDILDEGFTAGVFTYTFTGTDGTSHTCLWSEDMRWLMSIGVTEFTDGFNTSIGLNW